MKKLRDISKSLSISRVLLLLLAGFSAYAYFFAPELFAWARLTTNLDNQNLSLGGILSYCLLPGSPETAFISFAGLWYFAHRLEKMLDSLFFPVLIILIIALVGVLYSLFFWSSSSASLLGLEALSLFTVLLILFIKPKQEMQIIPGIKTASYIVAIATIAIWLAIKAFHYLNTESEIILWNAVYNAGFGLISATLTFFNIKAFNRYVEKQFSSALKDINLPSPEELSMAIITNSKMKKLYSQHEETSFSLSPDPDENEARLNEILDKIASTGKDSLTPNEIRFLEDYSKQL